ncbi:5921_t:CDS:2 [Acaulospora morrowiae]|uniref:FAD synthase n=1 Tax=Acaulospora morrowiae TaxID=94023 RepID=A0A9N9GEW1_9GLOM|nr:5921_t:CDS:2 [Acaulospora morrowiae]
MDLTSDAALDAVDIEEKQSFQNLTLTNGVTVNQSTSIKKYFSQIQREVYELANSNKPISRYVTHALNLIERSLEIYGFEGISISFNGGKDCVVLLHLLAAVVYKKFQDSVEKLNIQAVYITIPNPFPEVEEFVNESVLRYGLNLVKIGGPMKKALKTYSECYPNIKAILIGTRRKDPHGAKLLEFIPTDPDWPSFMRVNPILDWDYALVWEFLRTLNIPYCTLYDKGYTSLGSIDNTYPNSDLRNPNNPNGYDPAWKLVDESKERYGREH